MDEWMPAFSADATLVAWVSRPRKPNRFFHCGTRTSEVVFEHLGDLKGVIFLAIFDAHVQFIITRLGCQKPPKTEHIATSYISCSSVLPPAAEQELQDVPASVLTFAPIPSSLIFDIC